MDKVLRLTAAPGGIGAGFGALYPFGASDATLVWQFQRPDATTHTFATLEDAQTFTGALTLTAAAPQLILGVNATTLGAAQFFGSTSGSITVQPAAIAGGTLTCTLPNANSTLPIFTQQITFAGPTVPRTITLPDAAFTVARIDAGQIFTGVQQMTSPDITTSITTPSTTFTAFAGATTLLTIGGTGASAVVAIPGTKASTVSTDGSVTMAGGIGVAGNSNFGGTLGVTGAITGASYSGGAISGTTGSFTGVVTHASTPLSFHSTVAGAIQIGAGGVLQGHATDERLTIRSNVYSKVTTGQETYITTKAALNIVIDNGTLLIQTAPSGTADTTATMTTRFDVGNTGTITIASLAGSGSRTVVADANGVLSAP